MINTQQHTPHHLCSSVFLIYNFSFTQHFPSHPQSIFAARALCLEQTPAQQRRKSESILQQLEDPAQLALLLAHERKKSTHSFFHPYINALPSNPPCAWCMSDSELFSSVALLKRQGVATDDWLTEIAGHKASMMHLAEASVRGFGSALQVDVADVFWALGQVCECGPVSQSGSVMYDKNISFVTLAMPALNYSWVQVRSPFNTFLYCCQQCRCCCFASDFWGLHTQIQQGDTPFAKAQTNIVRLQDLIIDGGFGESLLAGW